MAKDKHKPVMFVFPGQITEEGEGGDEYEEANIDSARVSSGEDRHVKHKVKAGGPHPLSQLQPELMSSTISAGTRTEFT